LETGNRLASRAIRFGQRFVSPGRPYFGGEFHFYLLTLFYFPFQGSFFSVRVTNCLKKKNILIFFLKSISVPSEDFLKAG
jgi:hypothetical protein